MLRHWRLFAVATMAQCVVSAAVRIASIAKVRGYMRACRGTANRLVVASNEQIAWGIEATGRRLGRASSCLVRALVAEMLLDSAGGPVTLALGVRHTSVGTLEAHAWVLCGQRVLVGAPIDRYVPIVTWTHDRGSPCR